MKAVVSCSALQQNVLFGFAGVCGRRGRDGKWDGTSISAVLPERELTVYY